ncbi:hypothetical protein [Flagellimonas algicola]|uniref:Uncharacterized protein n=1 Tax=Flagellimonas algicola TaxID=2583815 RepID=A0ABY2WQU6_9FLAO|nr:hypothetical protein [Allomuricauda algicola]TMU57378.1 hypothetical protein FGG15_07490 [Allomuricauda algicola]
MGEFFKAELKDRFLEYALKRRDYFEVQVLYDEFLRPNYSLDFVQKLIKEIQEYDNGLLDIMAGNGVAMFMLASTSKTQHFLDEGGFMDMHVVEEEKWDTFLTQLSRDEKSSKGEKLLGKEKSPVLKKEKTLLIVLISAVVVSFLFTLFSLVNNAFLKPDYVPVDEFERKMEALRSHYQEENQQLEQALEKAQKTIDSLAGK